jgi:hypothetical protein
MGEKLTKTAEIIEHKGVQILLDNLSGLKGQELTDALKAVNTAMRPRTKDKKDWVCVNIFTGCFLDETAVKMLIRIRTEMIRTFLAIAEVGVSPLQKSSLELINAVAKSEVPMRTFNGVEEAKDWVVSVYAEQTRKKS